MTITDIAPVYRTPIKVRVTLRESQYIDMNQWKCTIHGEERIVTMKVVEWYCMNPEDAVHSFKISEIEFFTIEGKYLEQPPIYRP